MNPKNHPWKSAALIPPYPLCAHCRTHMGELGYVAEALPHHCRTTAALPQEYSA